MNFSVIISGMKAENVVQYPERHVKNVAHKAEKILLDDQIKTILGQAKQYMNNHGHVKAKAFKTFLTSLVKSFVNSGE